MSARSRVLAATLLAPAVAALAAGWASLLVFDPERPLDGIVVGVLVAPCVWVTGVVTTIMATSSGRAWGMLLAPGLACVAGVVSAW